MEDLALEWVLFAAGIILFLWTLVKERVKIWVFDLPPLPTKGARTAVRAISAAVMLVSFFILLGGRRVSVPSKVPSKALSKPTLRVFTGLAREEYKVFTEIVSEFGRKQRVTVRPENGTWQEALSRLEQRQKVDLITFDINGWRRKLVDEGLLEDLSRYKDLLPEAVPHVLTEHLEVNNKRYFIPFRPNVRLVFVNKRKYEELKLQCDELSDELEKNCLALPDRPETWWDVLKVAQIFLEKDGEVRVAIEGSDTDAPLFLLEAIRSAGGDPCNVRDPHSKDAMKFLHNIWPHVSTKSSELDWLTASGFLLEDSVYIARNWTWTLTIMRNSGRDKDFLAYWGWRWREDSRPSGLLGGEVLALPKNAPHKELAIELMRFLTSRDVQTKIVEKLSWPAMRLDALGGLKPWQRPYQRAINQALRYAEPVPEYWWPKMRTIYKEMFDAITKGDADIESELAKFQEKIERLEGCKRH